MASPPPPMMKLLIVGDSGVGKSCMLMQYANSTFSQSFITTIGIDYKIKNVEVEGQKLKLQIWDTAG
jgi:Ras-related protein Rab-8A